MSDRTQRTLVTGVIGSYTHIVGNRILSMALEKGDYNVGGLGAHTPAEEFVKAAIETDADAIFASSPYGPGELDCRGVVNSASEPGSVRCCSTAAICRVMICGEVNTAGTKQLR